jgi:hypothetical protein
MKTMLQKKKVAFYGATNKNKEGVYLQTFALGLAWVSLQALEVLTIGALTTHVRGPASSALALLSLLL